LLSALESADANADRRALSFIVIGGGPTGVEIAGAIVELLDVSVRHDRLRIDRAKTTVTVVDMGDRLLAGFSVRASKYARDELARRGVEIRLGAGVTAVDNSSVHFNDGSSIRADLVVWAGGVTVDGTLAASLPATHARGARVVIEHDLSLPGHPEVFVVGDAAAVPLGADTDSLAPQLAQVAMQSGRHAARQIVAALDGAPPSPFHYKDKGTMATIGRRAAVAELKGPWPVNGRVLRGTLGWFAWLGLHLVYLVGGRNRVVVLFNWLWRYVGWSAGPRIIVEDD
jgi:NADH dehydrogenase